MEHESQGYTISGRFHRNSTHKFKKRLKEIGIETQISKLQNTVLLETAQIP